MNRITQMQSAIRRELPFVIDMDVMPAYGLHFSTDPERSSRGWLNKSSLWDKLGVHKLRLVAKIEGSDEIVESDWHQIRRTAGQFDDVTTQWHEFMTFLDGFEGVCQEKWDAEFAPYSVNNTKLVKWEERDRLHLNLVDLRRDEATLVEFWDDDAIQFLEEIECPPSRRTDLEIQHAMIALIEE